MPLPLSLEQLKLLAVMQSTYSKFMAGKETSDRFHIHSFIRDLMTIGELKQEKDETKDTIIGAIEAIMEDPEAKKEIKKQVKDRADDIMHAAIKEAAKLNLKFKKSKSASNKRFAEQLNIPRIGGEKNIRKKQRSRTMEFMEYEPYQPGDDVRDIDINVLQRTDKLFVKRYEKEAGTPANAHHENIIVNVSNATKAELKDLAALLIFSMRNPNKLLIDNIYFSAGGKIVHKVTGKGMATFYREKNPRNTVKYLIEKALLLQTENGILGTGKTLKRRYQYQGQEAARLVKKLLPTSIDYNKSHLLFGGTHVKEYVKFMEDLEDAVEEKEETQKRITLADIDVSQAKPANVEEAPEEPQEEGPPSELAA